MADQSTNRSVNLDRIKRRKFIASAGATAVAGLAGCSGETDQSGGDSGSNQGTTTGSNDSGKVTLRFWCGSMTDDPSLKPFWEGLIKDFNAQSDNVEVNLRGVPYSGMFKRIRAGAQSGPESMPHIAEPGSTIQIAHAAEVLPLTDGLWSQSKMSDDTADNIVEMHRKFGQQITGEEQIVTWPAGVRPNIPIYRKDWLNQAGIDPSEVEAGAGALSWRDDMWPMFDAMLDTELAQQDGAAPSSTGMKQGDMEIATGYLAQWGATNMHTLNEEATHSILDTQTARDVIRFQKEGIEKGYFHQNSINHGDEEITTLQWGGKIAENHVQDCGDAWSSYRSELGDESYLEDYTWGLPRQKENKAVFSIFPMVIPYKKAFQSQEEKEAMVEFIDYLFAGDERQVAMTKELGWVPVQPSLLNSHEFFTQSELHSKFWGTMQTILEEFTFGTMPAVQGADQINFGIPRKMYQRIFSQGTSIEEATSIAAEEINNILKENGRYEPR